MDGIRTRCPRPHFSHLHTGRLSVLSALFLCEAPACPAGGPLRVLSPAPSPSDSGPPSDSDFSPSLGPLPSDSILASMSIRFLNAVRSELYNEYVDEDMLGFSYLRSLLRYPAFSRVRRSFSISNSVTFLVSSAFVLYIVFLNFSNSVTTLASSLRRSDISDLLTWVRGFRDQ